jgi:hypothetical protein
MAVRLEGDPPVQSRRAFRLRQLVGTQFPNSLTHDHPPSPVASTLPLERGSVNQRPAPIAGGGLALTVLGLSSFLVDAVFAARGCLGSAGRGKDPPMSPHIIGRPNDDLLDILLGHGADPEQAFIGRREQGLEESDGFEDRLLGEEPTVPEQ